MSDSLTSEQIDTIMREYELSCETLETAAGMDGDWETAFVATKNSVVDLVTIVRQLQKENAEPRGRTAVTCHSCSTDFADQSSYLDHVKVVHPC